MGVGGQFCSRKEKQISGTRGLVLLRPLQGRVEPSSREDDSEVSLAIKGLLSSALSSAYGRKERGDFYVPNWMGLISQEEVDNNESCRS